MGPRVAERHSLGLQTNGFRALLATQFLGALNVFGFLFFLVTAIADYAGGDAAAASRREALAYILAALPFVLLAGWAGAVADRFPKSSVMLATRLVEVAVMAGVVLACVLERGEWLYVLLFLLTAQVAFFVPAKHGFLAEMIAERELTRANALAEMATFVAIIAGHVGGAALYARLGHNLPAAGGAFLVVAVLGALACWMVPRSQAAHAGGALLNPLPPLLRTQAEVSSHRGVLYTVMPNEPGSLSRALRLLGDAGINIEYAYASGIDRVPMVGVVIAVADAQRASYVAGI